jgi:VanZ family protein
MVTRKRRSRPVARVALPGPGRRRHHRRVGAWRRLRSRRSRAAVAASVLLLIVLALTLVPLETSETDVPGTCIWCGHFALADAILNVLLFVPIGFALGLRRRADPMRIWGGLTMLSALIEATQIFLPGRFPTVSDVAANSLGAALGLLLAGSWKRGAPVHLRASPQLTLAAGLIAAVLTVGSTLLLRPSLPDSEWFGQWTAELGHYDSYDGRLLDARIGGIPAPSGRLPNTPATRAAILEGERTTLRYVAGPATGRLAPIFSIYDGMEREIFLFGGRRDDLVVRVRRMATDLRLRSPQTLYEGSASAAGDTVETWVEIRDGAVCADLDARCRALAPPGRGWSLLLGAAPSNLLERLADVGWLALLFLPLGYGFRRRAPAYAGLAIAAGGVLAAAGLGGGLQLTDGLIALAGASAGLGLSLIHI